MTDNMNLHHHISQQYNQELENIRNRVLQMGGMVEKQITRGLQAIMQSDSALGAEVAAADREINAAEVSLDEACTHILVRRQPAASDLRLLVMVLKTITDLERAGDEAAKLGRLAVQLTSANASTDHYQELRHMGEQVHCLLTDALNAFARLDVEAAIATAERDKQVDKEFETLSRSLITHMMQDPREIGNFLNINYAARALERIGDHSKNLCEYVVYLVEGKDIRHRQRN